MIPHSNRALVSKLLLVSASMFVFGVFAMPPLYDKFCEITGIGQAAIRIGEESSAEGAGNRTVKLFFDATANSVLPWEFAAVERSMIVNLGEPTEARYQVTSLSEVTSNGRAVYNVTPPAAARYFVKTECFCFSKQSLLAYETREMPVRFYIEQSLPSDITELTLSYTFFENQDSEAEPQVAMAVVPGTD